MLQITSLGQDSYQLFLNLRKIMKLFKYHLDFLLDVKNDQNLNYIFCRSDQDVFYKLSQIIWKGTKHKRTVIIIGGFHILLVARKE